jgi:hypothetical protein
VADHAGGLPMRGLGRRGVDNVGCAAVRWAGGKRVTPMVLKRLCFPPLRGAASSSRRPVAAIPANKRHKLRMAMARLSPLLVAMAMIPSGPAAAAPESPEAWTCERWLDARQHHRSKTIETWLDGYLTSSNQWALALGWAEAPLQVPEVLNLLDQNCKSSPNALLADVLDVIQSEFLRANWRDTK